MDLSSGAGGVFKRPGESLEEPQGDCNLNCVTGISGPSRKVPRLRSRPL
jgi:hypothetical protein